MAANAIARLDQVAKRFGNVRALEGVDLAVQPGELLAVLGPNGAGKTTMINTLLGLVQPDSGQVSVFGGDPRDAAIRRRCGVMLQISGVPDTLQVGELVRLFRSYYDDPMPIDEVVEKAGLAEFVDRRYGKLSGGQQQRTLFALAICGRPDLLFLDEPTAGLDVAARRRLWQVILSLRDSGAAIVLTTHYLEEADALADQIAVMAKGRIIAEGSPQTIKARVANKKVRCRTTLPRGSVLALDGVVSAEKNLEGWTVITRDEVRTLRALLSADHEVTDIQVTGADLEEAFLSLTDLAPVAKEKAA